MAHSPRDMTGYGGRTPAANWPNGEKIAVLIVLNHEEGGENNILQGDPASEAFLSEITGAALRGWYRGLVVTMRAWPLSSWVSSMRRAALRRLESPSMTRA